MLDTTKYGPNALGSLVRFGLLALVPLIALGAVLAHELNADVQQRYLETARTSATLITQVGIQPLLSAQQVDSGLTSADIATIDGKLQGASARKCADQDWNKSGTVVYSGQPGTHRPDVSARRPSSRAGRTPAPVSRWSHEENSGDNQPVR
jgi:hypothetical protein